MSETGSTAEDTPRTMCLAPSESLGASRDSTRASTPTEHDMDLPARPTTPKAGDQSAATDDVPMMDVSPIKEGRNSSP